MHAALIGLQTAWRGRQVAEEYIALLSGCSDAEWASRANDWLSSISLSSGRLLGSLKAEVRQHFVLLLQNLACREQATLDLSKQVKIAVSTADAMAKLKAGCMKGAARSILANKQVSAVILDEAETCELPQAMAIACGTRATFVLAGDENQQFHTEFPMYSRAPWISAEPETADKKRKRRDLVECSGDDAEEEHGPELRSRLANPEFRSVTQWLKKASAVATLSLTECQRCGWRVTYMLSRVYPKFLADCTSAPNAPDTWVEHVYYSGSSWESLQAAVNLNSPRQVRDVGWLQAQNLQTSPGEAQVVVLCTLSRISQPLKHVFQSLEGLVKVVHVDSARGLDCHICHIIRSRRYVGQSDQHWGLQSGGLQP